MRRGKHLAYHVEDRIVVQGIPNLLEFFKQALQYPAFNGVCGDKIEYQAILTSVRNGGCGPFFVPAGWDSRECHN